MVNLRYGSQGNDVKLTAQDTAADHAHHFVLSVPPVPPSCHLRATHTAHPGHGPSSSTRDADSDQQHGEDQQTCPGRYKKNTQPWVSAENINATQQESTWQQNGSGQQTP